MTECANRIPQAPIMNINQVRVMALIIEQDTSISADKGKINNILIILLFLHFS